MPPIDHFSIPRIHFGAGTFANAADLARPLGTRALIISNAPPALAEQLAAQLAAASIPALTIRQSGEPTTTDIDAALAHARSHSADLLLGLGGGSALDAAKAVAGLLSNGGTALDYMEVVGKGRKISRPAAPWIAIPTTAGTGAEVTRNAVIGFHGTTPDGTRHAFKASLRSEHLLARVALIDPLLALHLRAEVTARTGMDALCQCIEAYTSAGATPFTDPLALDGIARAARSLVIACTDPLNLPAREDLALAALHSGIALTNAGLGAVHGFAAPLGAALPIPHGTICAALLPHVVAANINALMQIDVNHPTLTRYATIGRTLMHDPALPRPAALEETVRFTRSLATQLRIPQLGTYGLTESQIPALVILAQKANSMRFNPIPLPEKTLHQILQAAL